MKKLLFFTLFTVACSSAFAQSLATFESWRNYSVMTKPLTIPDTWNASDSLITYYGMLLNPTGTFVPQVIKETPGNNGSTAALKVISKNQDAITGFLPAGPSPGLATNGKLDVSTSLGFEFSGGITHLGIPLNASFWVKNNPVNGDTTEVTILAIDNSDGGDSIVAVVDTLLGANITNYTQITMPFTVVNGSLLPNILRIIVTSSGNAVADTAAGFMNVHDGTYIIVDDIQVTSPAGVLPVMKMKDVASVYPTITSGNVHVQLKEEQENYTLYLMDLKGTILREIPLRSKDQDLTISSFANGTYYYYVSTSKKEILQTGKINKQ